jgi:hypothetical protein
MPASVYIAVSLMFATALWFINAYFGENAIIVYALLVMFGVYNFFKFVVNG